jgi:hypothetical protein
MMISERTFLPLSPMRISLPQRWTRVKVKKRNLPHHRNKKQIYPDHHLLYRKPLQRGERGRKKLPLSKREPRGCQGVGNGLDQSRRINGWTVIVKRMRMKRRRMNVIRLRSKRGLLWFNSLVLERESIRIKDWTGLGLELGHYLLFLDLPMDLNEGIHLIKSGTCHNRKLGSKTDKDLTRDHPIRTRTRGQIHSIEIHMPTGTECRWLLLDHNTKFSVLHKVEHLHQATANKTDNQSGTQILQLITGNKSGKFVEMEDPAAQLTKPFAPHGLLQAGLQDREDRSAKRQEELARETGTSLINVPSKPPPPQTGLLGAVAAHERERKNAGGIGATLTDRERERRQNVSLDVIDQS